MRKLVLAALIAAAPVLAAAQDLAMGAPLGKTIDEVTAALSAQGYTVRKAEMEDGKIEVYFVRDKTMGEVYVDPASGQITRLEIKGN